MAKITKKISKPDEKVDVKKQLKLKKSTLKNKEQKDLKPVKAIQKSPTKIEHVKIKNKNNVKTQQNGKENISKGKIDTKMIVNLQEAVKKAKEFASSKSLTVLKDVEKSIENVPEILNDGVELNELVPKDKIKTFVKNWLKIIEIENKNQKTVAAFGENYKHLNVQITGLKMANCPKRSVRTYLPHSLFVKDEVEICMFVADLKRGRKFDDEPTIQEYESKLAELGVDFIKKIIPISTLIKEYSSYELRSRLLNSYDLFFVEGKIADHVGKFLGKMFASVHKSPIPIPELTTKSINRALCSTTYTQTTEGPTMSVQFANTRQNEKQICENLEHVIRVLNVSYPGGWGNIRSIQLSTVNVLSIPIFINKVDPNIVPIPSIKSKREIAVDAQKKMFNDVLTRVKITENGMVLSQREINANTNPDIRDNKKKRNVTAVKTELVKELDNDSGVTDVSFDNEEDAVNDDKKPADVKNGKKLTKKQKVDKKPVKTEPADTKNINSKKRKTDAVSSNEETIVKMETKKVKLEKKSDKKHANSNENGIQNVKQKLAPSKETSDPKKPNANKKNEIQNAKQKLVKLSGVSSKETAVPSKQNANKKNEIQNKKQKLAVSSSNETVKNKPHGKQQKKKSGKPSV